MATPTNSVEVHVPRPRFAAMFWAISLMALVGLITCFTAFDSFADEGLRGDHLIVPFVMGLLFIGAIAGLLIWQLSRIVSVFRDAVQVLSARERSLLRMSLIDGLSIDEIAPMYQVHRATVARWLEAARERLAAVTRSRLAQALKLEPDAVDSLLASVQNGFDLSLSQALSSQVDSEG